MARRAKTPRFNEYQAFDNTFDNFSEEVKFKDGPYELELGCGRGEFVLELALRHPKSKFIGMDIKSDRMWFGAKQATKRKAANLVYVRAHAKDLKQIFKPQSLGGIWLTFPDPYPKKRQAKHRLTHPFFMEIYADLLAKDGWLRLKTDNDGLFAWSLEVFKNLTGWQTTTSGRDLHGEVNSDSDWGIMTQYEKKFLSRGKRINYIELKKV